LEKLPSNLYAARILRRVITSVIFIEFLDKINTNNLFGSKCFILIWDERISRAARKIDTSSGPLLDAQITVN
jgi:hypothetical protein